MDPTLSEDRQAGIFNNSRQDDFSTNNALSLINIVRATAQSDCPSKTHTHLGMDPYEERDLCRSLAAATTSRSFDITTSS